MMSLEMKYFVLKPRAKTATDIYAIASQRALCEYAETIKYEDLELSVELLAWADKEKLIQERAE